jgi:hypothetical protein
MARLKLLILVALSMGFLGTVGAQNLDMSGAEGSTTFDQPGKPTRGMTQERVRANFGEPQSTVAAIGDPPISRWVYTDFVVFFEYDKVIHSVTKR